MSADWVKPLSYKDRFYPGSPAKLAKILASFESDALEDKVRVRGEVIGIVTPHAGYVYSGLTAARSFAFARKAQPETVVILGLSHRVHLKGVSILEASACETPFGNIECDKEFGSLLLDKLPFASFNREAHTSEHSVETQLPFVKRTFPEARMVEILTQSDDPPLPHEVGVAIAETATELGRKILIVSSTDLSHYPPMKVAEEVDRQSLDWIVSLDPRKAAHEVHKLETHGWEGLTCAVCSKAALFSGMTAAVELGADSGALLGYTNSGKETHADQHRVVGYGAAAWLKG